MAATGCLGPFCVLSNDKVDLTAEANVDIIQPVKTFFKMRCAMHGYRMHKGWEE